MTRAATARFKRFSPASSADTCSHTSPSTRVTCVQGIVATWQPQETVVLAVIRELGLELQVTFNKGAVMVLPAGVTKATGLTAALRDLGLSPHNVVGVGDAENDHAFLHRCECAVAVANALPAVRDGADLITRAANGAGVVELIEQLLATDLGEVAPRLTRHHLLLGTREDGREVRVSPWGGPLLLAGMSGSGKSTLAMGFLERLVEAQYQCCILDPEGDYDAFAGAVVLADHQRAPTMTGALRLLEPPEQPVVVNLLGVPLEERPAFFTGLFARLQELRAQTGRPHWMVADEAHHLLPAAWQPPTPALTSMLTGLLLITVHPNQVIPTALAAVDLVIAVGASLECTLASFTHALGQPPPAIAPVALEPSEALVWRWRVEPLPFRLRSAPGRTERRRQACRLEAVPDNSRGQAHQWEKNGRRREGCGWSPARPPGASLVGRWQGGTPTSMCPPRGSQHLDGIGAILPSISQPKAYQAPSAFQRNGAKKGGIPSSFLDRCWINEYPQGHGNSRGPLPTRPS
jgi:hypothetical protein